ncbi:sensor histidine kinase [Paenibacillus sp. L3-i20]|uniref:sensor histidine kinase n=1 Tax=Paenibacillus sp. L3-i20 TaxID=2905833 RepID=UPI001EDF94AC|nr:ATP-binding protein [Paenibacillus sp. L3-i20]GKU77686.1 hypothetical protein L3i20_v220830 [Paenibacillus sp. L3-i20]
MRSFLHNKRISRLFIYSCLVLCICTTSYIQFRSLTTPTTGIFVEQNASSEWIVDFVIDEPITVDMNIRPGDRILFFDGSPNPRLFILNNEKMLTNVKRLTLLDKQGLQQTIVIEPTTSEKVEIGFAFLMEMFLLGVGWYAFKKKPDSSLIRKFFLLNMLIAFCMVAMFSNEVQLSYYLFPYGITWLTYFMLSFYLLFAFRSIHSKFQYLLLCYQIYSVGFTICANYFFFKGKSYQWMTDVFNIVLISTIIVMAGITAFYWAKLDRIEKKQLFILFISVLISLLPYLLLHAIPDLLWTGFIVSIKYTFVGLVPIICTLTFLLVRRQMLELKWYNPKLVAHIIYYSLAFSLIVLSSALGNFFYAFLLCVVFGMITYVYRKMLQSLKRHSDSKEDWLQNQKLRLSLQLTEKKYIRDILSMFAHVLDDKLALQGHVLVYINEPSLPIVHLSGIYEDKQILDRDNNDWKSNDEYAYVVELSLGANAEKLGYLCLGAKANATLFTAIELNKIEKFRIEMTKVLLNAKKMFHLHYEYEQNKEQMKRHEHQVHYFRNYSQMLIEAREAEKIRISYFLHDDLLQNLIFLSRDIEELHDTGRYEAERAAAWLKCLHDSQRSIRSLSDHLYPHILDRGDLQEALSWLIRDMNRENVITIHLQYDVPSPETFPAFIKANIFRAVRELIVNVFKHAQATEMNVRVWSMHEHIYCCVSDNGIGFSNETSLRHNLSGGKGFGLLSVCDQIEHLGGLVDVDSIFGEGTTVTLKLPLRKEG